MAKSASTTYSAERIEGVRCIPVPVLIVERAAFGGVHIMGSLFRALLLVLAPLGIATPECDPEALDDQKQQKQHALLSLHPQSPHFDGDPPLPRTGFDCAGLVAHVFKRAWKLS